MLYSLIFLKKNLNRILANFNLMLLYVFVCCFPFDVPLFHILSN
jgi:hypothetical protein